MAKRQESEKLRLAKAEVAVKLGDLISREPPPALLCPVTQAEGILEALLEEGRRLRDKKYDFDSARQARPDFDIWKETVCGELRDIIDDPAIADEVLTPGRALPPGKRRPRRSYYSPTEDFRDDVRLVLWQLMSIKRRLPALARAAERRARLTEADPSASIGDATVAANLVRKVFMAYASENVALAKELCDRLTTDKGITCFMAARTIGAGEVWPETLRLALYACEVVVVLVTPQSVNAPWVLIESGASWVLKKHLVPALVTVVPDDMPLILREHQAVDVCTEAGKCKLLDDVAGLIRKSGPAEPAGDGDEA